MYFDAVKFKNRENGCKLNMGTRIQNSIYAKFTHTHTDIDETKLKEKCRKI